MLIERVGNVLQSEQQRRWALSPTLIALGYYATGYHYATIGLALGIWKDSLSKVMDKVPNALLRIVGDSVRKPDVDELSAIIEGFNQKAGIIGAIDGTHFKIVRPPDELDGPCICQNYILRFMR